MKLVYLSHWRFPSEKTMTPLILKTCAHFARLGWEVELWVPRRRNEYRAQEDIFELYQVSPRFAVRRIPCIDLIRPLGTLGFLLMVLSFNISAWMRLRGERAVVYAHDLRDVIVPCLRGYPTFVEIHDFYESSFRFLTRFVLRRVRGLIVTNSHKMAHLEEAYGYPRARMLRQPNAVEVKDFELSLPQHEARRMVGLPEEGKIALYTGHLFSWKGVYTLADAAAHLPEEMRVIFVGGTPEDRQALERYVAKRRLPRITFVPHQLPQKIPLYQRAADVLVLPNTATEEASRVETSPVKLFEYLASGKPIVASDIPSIREVVSEREVTFARPDDGRDLARAILEALKDHSKTVAAQALARSCSWESRASAIDSFMRTHL